MLTATYSLVAINVEQNNARSVLSRLQQCVQTTWNSVQQMDLMRLEAALNQLIQFDQYFHARKVEMYVIPALKSATHEADALLAELEFLSMKGLNLLRFARDQLKQACEQGVIKRNEMRSSMELYCHNLLKRLAKEEEELFPIVQRSFSIEEWFSLAAQFLSEDERHYAYTPHAHLPHHSPPLAEAR